MKEKFEKRAVKGFAEWTQNFVSTPRILKK